MEKVQLTQKQADAIEYALNKTDDYKDDQDRLLRDISRDYVNFHNDLFPLNKIDIAVAAKALYVGYEVIPHYKAGESLFISKEATHTGKDEIRKIAGVQNGTIKFEDNWYIGIHSEYIRHATPEEEQQEKKRQFWEKLGREVDEYKQGDIVAYRDLFTPLIGAELNNREVHFPSDGGHFDVPIEAVRLSIPIEQRLDK